MIVEKLIEPVIMLPRGVKRAVAMLLDASMCVVTVWLALWLRLGAWMPLSGYGWPAAVASVLIAVPIFAAFGLYRPVFRYVGWDALIAILRAVTVYGVIYFSVFTAFAVPGVPRTVGIIQPILLLVTIGGVRALGRYWLGGHFHRRISRRVHRNVLIYGGGSAGRQLAQALTISDNRVLGFIDNSSQLHGSFIEGVQVIAPDTLARAVEDLDISEILLAIPSARQSRRNEILELIQSLGVAVRTLPGLLDLAEGRVTVNQLRPLEIEDLLGRDPVVPDAGLLEKKIRGKVVLVTGAGGSIGGELCRQIMAMEPSQLLLVEASEFALYRIHEKLAASAPDAEGQLVPLLASVCDDNRIRRILEAWRPDVIYHAAAYKHVPLVEHNVIEGVRNNVVGTLVCARAARDFGVGSFVLISTDKAVRPTNVMGASKRLAEMVLQALAEESATTCFSMVRFGNVLGSSGSVVPLFRQQIARGGPVTVTHPEVTRYFMTIREAAQLVLQAGAMARGGEVFVLDMGSSVRIIDLATRMVELSGLKPCTEANPDGDIEIVFTGLRSGEKLYEELLIGGNPTATGHPRIMMADEDFLALSTISHELARLETRLARQDVAGVREILTGLLPEYAPAANIVDWVFGEEQQAQDARYPESRPAIALAH